MSLAEVLPAARALDDHEKLLLIRALADDLAKGDEIGTLIPSGVEIPMWSPIEAYEAAAQLQKLLDEDRRSS